MCALGKKVFAGLIGSCRGLTWVWGQSVGVCLLCLCQRQPKHIFNALLLQKGAADTLGQHCTSGCFARYCRNFSCLASFIKPASFPDFENVSMIFLSVAAANGELRTFDWDDVGCNACGGTLGDNCIQTDPDLPQPQRSCACELPAPPSPFLPYPPPPPPPHPHILWPPWQL